MFTMFKEATSFNQDLSKWDVSRVTDMDYMFAGATAFKQSLCGEAWVNSKATNNGMFDRSSGSISTTVCGLYSLSTILDASTHTASRRYKARRTDCAMHPHTTMPSITLHRKT